jgi:hypothetical protein
MGAHIWPADKQIFLRKARSHPPSSFLLMTQEGIEEGDLEPRGAETFERSIFVYLVRRSSRLTPATSRVVSRAGRTQLVFRSSAPRRQAAERELDDFMAQPENVSLNEGIGRLTRRHIVLTRSREHPDTPFSIPDTRTTRQARFLDALTAAQDEDESNNDMYGELPIIFNGVNQSIKIHIPSLRRLFLPNIPDDQVPRLDDDNDIEDDDHQDDDNT